MIYASGTLTEQRFFGMVTTKVLPRMVFSQTKNRSTNDPSHSWQTRITFYISQCPSSSLGNHKCTRYLKLRDSKLNCRGRFPRRTDVTNPEVIPISGMKNPRQKVVPPNVTVVSQYPDESLCSLNSFKYLVVQSPEVKTPHPKIPDNTKAVSPVPVSQVDAPKNSSDVNEVPAKISESCETKTSNTTATRSNLVSLIKTSLRQKHSKENVQPLPNMFKGKRNHNNSTKATDGPRRRTEGRQFLRRLTNKKRRDWLTIYTMSIWNIFCFRRSLKMRHKARTLCLKLLIDPKRLIKSKKLK